MKTFLLSLGLVLAAATAYGQKFWNVNFDDTSFLGRIVRDTISNPNCSWQIGHPAKTVFTAAHSGRNAIVTDTLNPVPARDTSIFYLKHVRNNNNPFHICVLQFWYQMDGDTTDFGKIEISPDTGKTWVNVLTQDTTYRMNWNPAKPSLKGSTNGWQFFYLDFSDWASSKSNFPTIMTADTILFRFTYTTDSNSTLHDGWMIDDFHLEDWWEGISGIQNDNLISIYPNPTADVINIHQTKRSNHIRVEIFNYTGQVLFDDPKFSGDKVDTRRFPNGIYLLKYSDGQYFSIKRFVVQH